MGSPRRQRETKLYTYTVQIVPAEEGGFVVSCPALPGCVTQGETIEEAREMAKEAILGYLEALQKDGRPIPEEVEPLQEKVTVGLGNR